MTWAQLIPLTTPLLTLAVAILVLMLDLVFPPGQRKWIGWASAAGLLLVLVSTWAYPVSGAAFGGSYVQDGFALFMQRIFLVAGVLGTLGSVEHGNRHFPKRQAEFHLMLLSSLTGMMFLAGAKELVLLLVSFELMGIPLYVLAAMHKRRANSVEAAVKLFLSGAVGSLFVLFGVSFVVGVGGSTMISELASTPASPLINLGMMLTLGGMAFKLGAVPFHMWVPDTYQGAPTPYVAFLSIAPKAAGFAAMSRIFLEGFGGLRHIWWPALLVIGIVTVLIGNLFAVPQNSIKRILAYSGVGHIGLMLFAFGIGTTEGLATVLFYLAAYLFTNMGAFFVVDAVETSVPDTLSSWKGLSRKHPALSLAMLLFLLSLGGIPFMSGFWAKILLFWAIFEAGFWSLVLFGGTLAMVGLFYYLKIARAIYIEEPDADTAPSITLGRSSTIAIAICVIGVVGMGLYPRPFVDAALSAAAALLGG